MKITLKRDDVCAECGAVLKTGQEARWYRNGKVYGLTCHPQIEGKKFYAERPKKASAAKPMRKIPAAQVSALFEQFCKNAGIKL
jgi:hypothetical protein